MHQFNYIQHSYYSSIFIAFICTTVIIKHNSSYAIKTTSKWNNEHNNSEQLIATTTTIIIRIIIIIISFNLFNCVEIRFLGNKHSSRLLVVYKSSEDYCYTWLFCLFQILCHYYFSILLIYCLNLDQWNKLKKKQKKD